MRRICFVLMCASLIGCQKGPGEGGDTSIIGKISLEQWNSTFTVMSYEAPATEYNVYIVYGDNVSFSDKTETDFEGEFEFSYLRPGDYTVYAYSKVNSADAINGDAPDEEAIIRSVSVCAGDDEVVVPEITVLDN